MKYLLYCILQSPELPILSDLQGIGGHAVFLISAETLSAAASRIEPSKTSPEISHILAYERVVEAFHEKCAIIPMRYGSTFEKEAEVIRFLDEHSEKYHALLKRLDGCAEMGIRVLLRDDKSEGPQAKAGYSRPGVKEAQPGSSGHAYLASRKVHYEAQDKLALEKRSVIDLFQNAFAGLFVDFKTEEPTVSDFGFLSLYFLVPKSSIESFKEVFEKIDTRVQARLLLSGPWPPYNFV